MGVHRVTNLEQFPVQISKDEASFDCYLLGRYKRKTTTLWFTALRIPQPHIHVAFSLWNDDCENTPHSPFASVSVCDIRDLHHGSRAYFEIKTSTRNLA